MATTRDSSRDDPLIEGAPNTDAPASTGRDKTIAPDLAATASRARRLRASRFQLLLLALIITFGGLAFLARSTPYWGFDLTITRAIQSIDVYGFGTLLDTVSWIGFPPQFPVICALIVVALFLLRRAPEAWMLMLTSAGAGALWFASTRLIARPRPSADLVRVGVEVHGGSFPSGHVLTTVAIFGFVVFLAYTRLRPSWQRTLLLIVFGLPIMVVGIARIYAGHHWPSDVLGGYMLGGMWLSIMIHVYHSRVGAPAQSNSLPSSLDTDASQTAPTTA